jgi:hypothetical protein
MPDTPVSYLIAFAVLIALFFLVRSLVLWYFGIIEITDNQEKLIKLFEENNELLKGISYNTMKEIKQPS